MKKRLLATVLAVAMMGTLAACGNGTKTDSAEMMQTAVKQNR